MRLLLSTIGTRGDVQPLVALGLQLKALGHEVRFCAPPDFRAWIEGLGFAVTPVGAELRRRIMRGPPGPPPLERVREVLAASVAAQFETVAHAVEACDVIVAASSLQIAARSLAELSGIPYVFAAYCPAVLPSSHHAPSLTPFQLPSPAGADARALWARDAESFNATFGVVLNAHRAALGLPPVEDVRSHVLTERPWLAADPTLAPWPEPEERPVFQPGAWIVPDERELAPVLRRFLDAGEAPVYFGFGSMRAEAGVSGVMIESARALGRRAIVSRGWSELSLGDAEPDCLVVGEVNHDALFRRVAAVAHHGGAGTITAAALAGAPQVVMAQGYDQHYWGRRVEQLGIGAVHGPDAPNQASLTAALEAALRPEVTARAGAVAGAVRQDGAEVAAKRLVTIAERSICERRRP